LFATMPALRASDGPSLVRSARAAVGPGADGPVFATLTGGLEQLVRSALAAAGAEVLAGRAVRRISRTPSGFQVVHGPTTDEKVIDADAVVVAVPAAPASRLLADVAPLAAAELSGIDYASVAIASFRYDVAPAGEWSGFLVPAVEERAVKAATYSSLKWSHLDGLGLVRCSLGRVGEVALLQRSDEELMSVAAADISAMTGLPAPVESRITRWGGGLPQYGVGHLARVERIRAAVAAIPGLAVCGAAYDGVGIPACIRSGYAAAAQVG